MPPRRSAAITGVMEPIDVSAEFGSTSKIEMRECY
jgi:hypothetical protein